MQHVSVCVCPSCTQNWKNQDCLSAQPDRMICLGPRHSEWCFTLFCNSIKKRNITIKIHPVLFLFKQRLYHIYSLHQTRWARINGILLLIKDFSPGSLGCQCVFAWYPALSWISSHCLCIIPCLYVMVYYKSRVCLVLMLLMKDIWQAHVTTHGAQGPMGHDMTLYNRAVVRTEVGLNITRWNSFIYKTFNLKMRSVVITPHWYTQSVSNHQF